MKLLNNFINTLNTSLGAKLIFIVSALFLITGICFIAINTTIYLNQILNKYQDDMNFITSLSSESNTSNVWNLDAINLNKYIESQIKNDIVVAIVFEIGVSKSQDIKNRYIGYANNANLDLYLSNISEIKIPSGTYDANQSHSITYHDEKIGNAYIYFSKTKIMHELYYQISLFIFNLLLFLMLFSALVYYFFRNQLLKPLAQIHQLALSVCGITTYLGESVSAHRWGHIQTLLQLEKSNLNKFNTSKNKNELGDFIETFSLVLNGFEVVVTELTQYSQQVSMLNEELEEKITVRTSELESSNTKLTASLEILQQAQGQLLQQEKLASIGQLAAGVAHEINNPIGYVGSNINRLGEYFTDITSYLNAQDAILAPLPDDIKNSITSQFNTIKKKIDYSFLMDDYPAIISDCKDGILRIKEIVQSLKDFSHNASEKDFSQVDLSGVIKTTLKVLNNEIKYSCDIAIDLKFEATIFANLGQMHQVISNIIVNAAHAIKETKIKGMLYIKTYEDPDFVTIEIKDTGNGIPEHARDKIFDPFFTTKPVGVGTGLGLNICYDIIVNKHSGKLFFESTLGEGTTFFIYLPKNNTA